MRKDAMVKAEVLKLVERSPLSMRQTLMELEVPPATYYRWRRRHTEKGLEGLRDLPPRARRVWNRLPEEERGFIVCYALEHPSLSPREVSVRLVDRESRFVSESTVYRILRQAGLLKPHEAQGFPAEKEYRVKTTGPDQLWHTDASYFFVAGWGYYYLISVLDDYSRMVLASRIQPNMASTSIIEVIQDAVEEDRKGYEGSWTAHDLMPLEEGGSNKAYNCVILCITKPDCHLTFAHGGDPGERILLTQFAFPNWIFKNRTERA